MNSTAISIDIEADTKELLDKESRPISGSSESGYVRKLSRFWRFAYSTVMQLWSFRVAIKTSVVNRLRKRYHRSILGFGWSLLNPLMTMLVLTLVFSMLFRQSPKDYAAYLIVGLLPWNFIRDSILASSNSIIDGEYFLKKVAIPSTFFPVVTVITEAVNFVLCLCSLALLGYFIGLSLNASLLLLPVALALTTAFVIAISIVVSVSTVYFRDLTHILGIFLNCLFYLTPIFYSAAQVPDGVRVLFLLNPICYFLDYFRIIIYDGRFPSFLESLAPLAISIFSLLSALIVLKLKGRELIYRL